MKKVLLALLFALPFTLLNAQNCEPDLSFMDSVGVFPLPYEPDLQPDGGISECAVIGENYSFVFTVSVSDSITAEVFGSEVTLPLDMVIVDSVKGLPIGLNYSCEPTNCEYEKNSIGCAIISGVPTDDNTPGDYSLTIFGTAVFPIFPFTYSLSFPGVLAEGEYIVRLLATAGEDCGLVATKETLADRVNMLIMPNPTSGLVNIDVTSLISGDFDMQVVDLLGQPVYQEAVRLIEGSNTLSYNAAELPNGLYYLLLKNETGQVAQKLMVQH